MTRFGEYLREKRNEILLKTIGVLLTTLIVGTVAVVFQEAAKRAFSFFFPERTTIELRLVNSAVAVFPATPTVEIVQLLTYEIAASDLVKSIKVSVVFKKDTEISRYNIVYSVDIEGFGVAVVKRNHLVFSLKHALDVTKRATIQILTKRVVNSPHNVVLELPDIHVEGTDKDGRTVYR